MRSVGVLVLLLVTLVLASCHTKAFAQAGLISSNEPPQNAPASESVRLTANFRYAPWSSVLKWYADELGLALDLGEVPPGTFNYYDKSQLTATELLDVFNGYLLPKGYLLVRRDNFLACVNVTQGVPPSLVPLVTLEELALRGRNELVSVVVPVYGGSANEIAEEFEALLGPQGRIVAMQANRSVAVVGIGTNVKRIVAMLTDSQSGASRFRAFQLRHISAGQATATVRSLMASPDVVPATTALAGVAAAIARRRQENVSTLQLSADIRTNRLFVVADISQLNTVEQILKAIDVSTDPTAASAAHVRVATIGRQSEIVALERLLANLSPRIRVTSSQSSTALRNRAARENAASAQRSKPKSVDSPRAAAVLQQP